MANTLRFKRGLAAGIPTGVAGEPLFTTDTFDLYIGNGTTNTRFQKYIASGTTSQYLRGDGPLATFPSLTGFVPYTGATANVDLGTHTILAQNATISSSGSGNTATITHSSGSGIGLNITKGGSGEGLYINKTSGSGNAATIIGTLNATTLVKSGGTSTQYLMADGSVSTLTNPITGTGSAGQVAYFTGATTQAGSNNLFWDSANGRLGIGTNGPQVRLSIKTDTTLTKYIEFGYSSSLGSNYIESLDRVSGNSNLALYAGQPNAIISFYAGSSTERARISGISGNLLLGSTTDSGQRLQVTGDTLLKGSGNTNATTALTVQNSASTNLFRVLNDSMLRLGTQDVDIFPTANGSTLSSSGRGLIISTSAGSQSGVGALKVVGNYSSAISNDYGIWVSHTFSNGVSGVATHSGLLLNQTINQTGGANGITRGLYVNPTLTAAADWRSIEWSNNTGWGLYGAGTAQNYIAGNLGIGTTTLSNSALRVNKAITGAVTQSSIANSSTINSDVTSNAWMYISSPSTQAAAFTISEVVHFNAFNLTIGASSAVTNNIGFKATSTLTGATNNWGFYGDIPSGTGRWNLYMNGTAKNYLAGELLVTTLTSVAGYQLAVGGAIYASSNIRFDTAIRDNRDNSIISQSLSSVVTNRVLTIGNGTYLNINFPNGNMLIGSTTDSGEKLQVTGTAKITGASSFGGNMTLSLNQNASTSVSVTNTTSGTNAYSTFVAQSNGGGLFEFGKYSQLKTGYKILASGDGLIFNDTYGDIAILNNVVTGNIKFAAGGSSTAQMTIKSNGRINMSSLPTSATGLSAGDLWNDGGTLKIV
jgi:hypothetical protein